MIKKLRRLTASATTSLHTFDAKSLYISIPLGKYLDVIAYAVQSDPLYLFLVRTLFIVLFNNYFNIDRTLLV